MAVYVRLVQVQYATTDLSLFSDVSEDIKTTWFLQVEAKVVRISKQA